MTSVVSLRHISIQYKATGATSAKEPLQIPHIVSGKKLNQNF